MTPYYLLLFLPMLIPLIGLYKAYKDFFDDEHHHPKSKD